MLPSSSDLGYFVEVATTLNISRAAERLGISQPSLTLAMRRLEDAVGTQVLIRTKKGVTLTQAGKQLLAHSRQLLQTWEGIKAQALSSVEEVQGAYVLGCHPSVALYSLYGFMPDLLERYTKLNIQLSHDLSRKITEGVISSQIDIGIVVNPVQHPDLVIQKLCDDEVTFWVGAGKSKTQDLNSKDCVLICDGDLLQTQSLIKSLRKSKQIPSRTIETASLEVVASLTSSGCGIGILPTRVARQAPRKLKQVAGAPSFSDEICLIFRMENRGVKAIQIISDAIKAFFQTSN